MMFHSFTVKPILYLRILIILLILRTLHSKLSKNIDANSPISSMDYAILYDGSIVLHVAILYQLQRCLKICKNWRNQERKSIAFWFLMQTYLP
jgi:hypothetical protein